MHIAGLVLARGGSKSIPLKNLALLGGRPLLVRSLQTMSHCQGIQYAAEYTRISYSCIYDWLDCRRPLA